MHKLYYKRKLFANRVKSLSGEDPTQAKRLFDLGESILIAARKGELSKMKKILFGSDQKDILFYFISKAFQEALINDHLMIAAFMVENGFPVNSHNSLPPYLHDSILVLDDERCVPVIKLFLNFKCSFDINTPAPRTWLTPLHIAVQRLLCQTTEFLVSNGADVNAVADEDLMPLNIAQAIDTNGNAESEKRKEFILSLLIKHGAKETWRRNIFSQDEAVRLEMNSSSATAKHGRAVVSTFTNSDSHLPVASISSTVPTKMVRFTGGSEGHDISVSAVTRSMDTLALAEPKLPLPPPPPQAQAQPPSSNVIIKEADAVGDMQEMTTVAFSDDGGMLFSTG